MPRSIPVRLWWVPTLVALACTGESAPIVAADRGALVQRLDAGLAQGPLDPRTGEWSETPTHRVAPMSLALRPGWRVAGAVFEPKQWVPGAGLLIAQGHFGEGKSAPEAQNLAHRMAARGVRVVIIDTPGMEEWTGAGRAVHFDEGRHNRAWLAAHGSSAMALMLAGLDRGLAWLRESGAERIGVAGASGGAVQAFYMMVRHPDLSAGVFASFVPLPREARAGGCPCDQVPRWPGPDPGVVALVQQPSLWLADVAGPPPKGLGVRAVVQTHEGEHGFGLAMQGAATAFLTEHLGARSAGPGSEAVVPHMALQTEGPTEGAARIMDLPLPELPPWQPAPMSGVPYEVDCEGSGPVVLQLGGDGTDRAALTAVGLRVCETRVPQDETAQAEAVATGGWLVDRELGGVRAAARQHQAVGVYAVRAHGLVASAMELPFVLRAPLHSPGSLDPALDAPWIHIPGGFPEVSRRLEQALAQQGTPAELALALNQAVAQPAP